MANEKMRAASPIAESIQWLNSERPRVDQGCQEAPRKEATFDRTAEAIRTSGRLTMEATTAPRPMDMAVALAMVRAAI